MAIKLKAKSWIASLLTFILIVTQAPFYASAAQGKFFAREGKYDDIRIITDPDVSVYYSFEQVTDGEVINETGGSNAILGAAASIEYDAERGSHVLNLPGGKENAGSWLSLPNDLFSEVKGAQGFGISLWLYVPGSGSAYSRLFSASPYPLGSTYSGANWWYDPEFSIVRGGGDYHLRLFTGIADNGSAQDGIDLMFDRSYPIDKWQNLIITMKNNDFAVYLDGQQIANVNSSIYKRFDANNISSVLPQFFDEEYLSGLTNNALGRSLYTSDDNFRGKIDDFTFYNRYLTLEDVAAISGSGDPSALIELWNEAKSIAQGNYTSASYQILQNVITEVDLLLASSGNPKGIIDEALEKLTGAINGLKEPLDANVEPDYYYSFDLTSNTDNLLMNEGDNGQHDAKLERNASLVIDKERGQVLNLPGGSNGSGGWLSLSEELFSNVDAESGFTVAMWVKLANDVHQWSRLFDAGSQNYASGAAPFIYLSTLNGSEINAGNNQKEWMNGVTIKKNEWVHVAYSVNGSKQTLYLNGMPIKSQSAIRSIFDAIEGFNKTAIGRSRFSADPDLKAKLDDVMFFSKELNQSDLISIIGHDYDASITAVRIGDRTISVEPGQTKIHLNADGGMDLPGAGTIIPILSNSNATYTVERVKTYTSHVVVTSPNKKNVIVYELDFYDPEQGPRLNFLMNERNGEIMHGASGFLYGISEPNIPTIDLLKPLKPKVAVQKAPGGLQHPSGDGVRVSDALKESGVEQIQIYIQDMYYQWPYEYKGLDQYEQLVIDTVRKAEADKNKDKYVYVLFNEPDQIWFWDSMNEDGFFAAWKRIYNVVKSEAPDARVAGPNVAGYNHEVMEKFIAYCVEKNCLPDVVTWHELGNDNGSFEPRWEANYTHYRNQEAKYNIEEKPIVINEYSWFEDPGAAGSLIQWLSRFEMKKVYGSVAYWHLANSLNEMAADANKPNGAWWLYKWYADMSGETVQLETYNVQPDGLYGLATIDESRQTAFTIFGGQDGLLNVTMNGLDDSIAFSGEDKVHVKLYRTKFTGYYGMLDAPRIEFDGNVALKDGSLDIKVADANALDGFFAIVTRATNDSVTAYQDFSRVWTNTWEAEDAEKTGVTIGYLNGSPVSGGKYVKGLSSVDSSVTFSIDVPQDGKYKLEIFYGNNAPNTNGRNRAQGELGAHRMVIDDSISYELIYDSTIYEHYFGSKSLIIELKEGKHTLKFSKLNGMDVSLDKIDLTYAGAAGSEYLPRYRLEAEEARYSNGFSMEKEMGKFSSAGYVTGKGDIDFTVVVEKDGYYNVELGYAAETKQAVELSKMIVNYAADATPASTLGVQWLPVSGFSLNPANAMSSASGKPIYLTAGANLLRISSSLTLSADYLQLTYNAVLTEQHTQVIEAEQAQLFGTAYIERNDHFSNGSYVAGIGESSDNGLRFNVDVEKAGAYKLKMVYSNNEPAPAIVTPEHPDGYIHPYNTDLVERYAQIVVNEGTPQTIYFINTLSWNSTRSVVVDIELKAGSNSITVYNDNSYRFSNVVQYAPYFDKFEIAPASLNIATSGEGENNGGGNNGVGNQDNGNHIEEVIQLLFDGQKHPIYGEVTLSEKNGGTKAVVKLNREQIVSLMKNTSFKQLTVPISTDADEYEIMLDLELMQALGSSNSTIVLETKYAAYKLPASMFNIDEIGEQLKLDGNAAGANIRVTISAAAPEAIQQIRAAALNKGIDIVGEPVQFSIKANYQNRDIHLNSFDRYVERIIAIPEHAAITTAVVLDKNGNIAHVPTNIIEEGGKHYAVIHSRTNSVYALISNVVSFDDVERHWSKNDVNGMGARLIVEGTNGSVFMPNQSITRAEFSAIMTRALGLYEKGETLGPVFTDVSSSAWYYEAVHIAASHGLIGGYQDGSFRPNQSITREEAFKIVANAMALTTASDHLSNDEIDQLLADFIDSDQVGSWALSSAGIVIKRGIVEGNNGKLMPKAQVSRAQAAAMIRRLLIDASLIDG